MQTGPQPFGEFWLRVGDVETYAIDWPRYLANRWLADSPVALAYTVRPVQGVGFQFVCTTAGQTAGVEPAWPTTVGATVRDGAAVWTCAAVDTTSLSDTIASAAWTAPAGVTLANQALAGNISQVRADFSSAAAGTDYTLVCAATLQTSGRVRHGNVLVHIR